MSLTRRHFHQSGLALAAAAISPSLLAQQRDASGYPNRPIKLMIPFAPGGGTDIVGRAVGEKLSQALGQSVVVENRAGANGTIGANLVARSPADGHTLCMFTASHSVNVSLQGAKLPYNLLRDFAPIIHFASQPYILVVKPSLPVKTVKEFLALSKTKPGGLNYGSSGVGGLIHLASELLANTTGTKFTHVPYKGGAEAMADVVSGNVDFMITSYNQAKPFIDGGQLRLLAVTTRERSAAMPKTPTLQEEGVAGYDVVSWYGFAAPAGTPEPIMTRLNTTLNQALKAKDMSDKLVADGAYPIGGSGANFAAFMAAEVKKWDKLISDTGIQVGG
jgi:tripartite-type tricarboxylate transporter receptor subunit TctC